MKRRSLSTMTAPELINEISKMDKIIDECKEELDDMSQARLASARALKFACECQMNNRKLSPAPAPMSSNVIDFAEYKLKRAQKHGH